MEEIRRTKGKVLNRDQIKYIAVILMALNHIASIFLKEGTVAFLMLFCNLWIFYSTCNVLFSGGRLLLHSFQKTVWTKAAALCAALPDPFSDRIWRGAELETCAGKYDPYIIYMFSHTGMSG